MYHARVFWLSGEFQHSLEVRIGFALAGAWYNVPVVQLCGDRPPLFRRSQVDLAPGRRFIQCRVIHLLDH
jgi:hypothetical protein